MYQTYACLAPFFTGKPIVDVARCITTEGDVKSEEAAHPVQVAYIRMLFLKAVDIYILIFAFAFKQASGPDVGKLLSIYGILESIERYSGVCQPLDLFSGPFTCIKSDPSPCCHRALTHPCIASLTTCLAYRPEVCVLVRVLYIRPSFSRAVKKGAKFVQ